MKNTLFRTARSLAMVLCFLASTDGPLLAPALGDDGASKLAVSNPANTVFTAVAQRRNSRPTVISGDLSTVNWNALVGKQVVIRGDLVIVDTYDLVRRGQVKVARERLYIPTSHIDPNDKDPNGVSYTGGNNVRPVIAAQKYNDNATIILDDGSAAQNIFPPTLFPELGTKAETVRLGSVIAGVSGKLIRAGNNLLLVVDKPLKWVPATRPEIPSVGEAAVSVASFNVLNYFTTIDNGRNNARGADSRQELERQQAKIVSAMLALDADVFGLMEVENNVEAEEQLVNALNRKLGRQVFRACGVPDGFSRVPGGGDAIRVGIIYRSDRVTPLGSVTTIRDEAFASARAPIVQSFRAQAGGEPFTLIVNHFKSKGGASDADQANKNKGDGQSAYNAARRNQALALASYVADLRNSRARVLVVGDLNAYQQEDPIDALRAEGFVDLHERFDSKAATNDKGAEYSYVYFGQCGSLDHALATESLARDVTGVAVWHINADEPRFLDYNQEFNPESLYRDNPFRSSDHDPVLIGIGR